jgi:hypothetical protein
LERRKHWLRTGDTKAKQDWVDGVKRVVTQLRETAKEDRAEAVAAGSVEGQQALRVREIQAHEANAAASKRTADALEAQGEDLRVIRRCLTNMNDVLTTGSSESTAALVVIAVSVCSTCVKPSLTPVGRSKVDVGCVLYIPSGRSRGGCGSGACPGGDGRASAGKGG